MKAVGLLPAAGMGTRIGLPFPKELICIQGKALIEYSMDLLLEAGIRDVVLVLRKEKTIVGEYLSRVYPAGVNIEVVYQTLPCGPLINPIKSALPLVLGHRVHLLLPDTVLRPNPFAGTPDAGGLFLYCFKAENEMWRNFGPIDPICHRVLEKPDRFVSSICWGAATWGDDFSRHLEKHTDFPEAVNSFGFNYRVNIASYTDYGLTTRKAKMVELP